MIFFWTFMDDSSMQSNCILHTANTTKKYPISHVKIMQHKITRESPLLSQWENGCTIYAFGVIGKTIHPQKSGVKGGISGEWQLLRASPPVLGTWSCTVKFDEESPTHASLAQENGFGSASLHRLPWLVNQATAALCTCIKECINMI
jgi:hypothetical protein